MKRCRCTGRPQTSGPRMCRQLSADLVVTRGVSGISALREVPCVATGAAGYMPTPLSGLAVVRRPDKRTSPGQGQLI